jgi:anionic cell wall polymer biosynthesis LytR-Cps2A-Psr (LCP) family protein
MIKDKSIKLIAMISKKIILEKRITKYKAIIEDIDEYVQDNLNSTKNIKDFENIFNKLKSEYKSKLVDTSEEEDEEDNETDKNENDNDNDKMEIVEK